MDVVPERWYAVLDPAEVPRDRPIRRRRMGEDLVFWRDETGRVRAAVDRCPHRAAALSLGRVHEGCLVCPFHGFRFASDGRCVEIPAHPDRAISPAMSLSTWHAREEHDLVWLWTGAEAPPDDPIPFFDFEGMSWRGSQVIVDWNVHYTRAIENQLDMAHLPFVHCTTIGRGLPTAVDVVTEVSGDHVRAHQNRSAGAVHVIGPNIWRLELGPRLSNFLAFVPVDDEHMTFYVRAYQRMVTWPGLSWLFGRLQALANPVILRQDQRVVETQRPLISSLDNDEVLVPSDRPIIEYLRWRRRVKSEGTARATGA